MLEDTPILAALVRQVRWRRSPLHVPGHKQGRLLPDELSAWLGAAAKLDLTELPGLDNLYQPEGCIAESERLAAQIYGSDACLYSVGGSTAGVMAAILSFAGNADEVLFLNRFHVSAWRGLVLAGAVPVFMRTAFVPDTWEFAFPDTAQVVAQVRSHPRVKAAFLTSPTYPGLVANVAELADALHALGVPLIVDEAHGAHLGLHPRLPQHSVAAGADLVVQSTHKMLPALTQTAWVHCRGPRVDAAIVAHWLGYLQSTSPSYLLLASLDAVQAWLRSDGPAVVDAGLGNLAGLAAAGRGLALSPQRDPFKLWVPTGSVAESRRLVDCLAEAGVELEYADGFGALGVFGLCPSVREVQRVSEALADWHADYGGPDAVMRGIVDTLESLGPPRLGVPPRVSEMESRRRIALGASIGCTLAAPLTPYPPGVPVAYPGQVMDRALLAALRDLVALGATVHGVTDGQIAVMDEPVAFATGPSTRQDGGGPQ